MPGTTSQTASPLNVVAALAGTSGALQQTLLALAQCHGGRSGRWLDDLEAVIIRNTNNMTFTNAPVEVETVAVECALASVTRAFEKVREVLKPPRHFTITVTAQPAQAQHH